MDQVTVSNVKGVTCSDKHREVPPDSIISLINLVSRAPNSALINNFQLN